jgi:hypothetical protein
MSASTRLVDFRQWFEAGSGMAPSGLAIVLHGSDGRAPGRLAHAIADYLNEFDDETGGHWLAFDPAMLDLVVSTPEEIERFGIDRRVGGGGPGMLKQAIRAIAARGHAVLDTPLAAASTQGLAGSFHVGLGLPAGVLDQCHMILNPRLFGSCCLAPVIGDTFLQWSATCLREMAGV